jgi:hypothetical protein
LCKGKGANPFKESFGLTRFPISQHQNCVEYSEIGSRRALVETVRMVNGATGDKRHWYFPEVGVLGTTGIGYVIRVIVAHLLLLSLSGWAFDP